MTNAFVYSCWFIYLLYIHRDILHVRNYLCALGPSQTVVAIVIDNKASLHGYVTENGKAPIDATETTNAGVTLVGSKVNALAVNGNTARSNTKGKGGQAGVTGEGPEVLALRDSVLERALDVAPVILCNVCREVDDRSTGVGGAGDFTIIQLAVTDGIPRGIEQAVAEIVCVCGGVVNVASVLRAVNVTKVI